MVSWLSAALIAVGILLTTVVFIAMFRDGKPLRRLIGSAAQGIGAIIAVNLAATYSGVSLGLSWLSAVGCALLGVPGVVSMLLLKVILGIQ